ncbi:hypothetical protein [Bifidobacterium leontopitheci]|nr:hypothetical protein [Bifidobacterium leontopitheci]
MSKAVSRGIRRGLGIATNPDPHGEFQRIRRSIMTANAEVGSGTSQISDGGIDPEDGQRALIARASYWEGAVPSPEDMAAFKRVDATFPERILSMTEQTVDTQNKALRKTISLEQAGIEHENVLAPCSTPPRRFHVLCRL